MKKRIVMVWALLMLLGTSALAQSVPMDAIDLSDHERFGFGRSIGFTAGCLESGGAQFLLVDTFDFNGHYLLCRARGQEQWDVLGGGMMIEPGSSVTLEAQDAMFCSVRIEKDGETQVWHFAEEPDPERHPDWVLAGYERAVGDDFLFAASYGDCCAHVMQTQQGQTRSELVYYAFFRDSNNLDYARLPRSLEDALRLQEAYPVAAVSPKNPEDRVNLREGPSTSYPRAGSLYSGALLWIEERRDGWARIYVGDAQVWISEDFLTYGSAISAVADSTKPAQLRADGWIKVSRMPYMGGGGTVTQRMGGVQVRVIGEYNSGWRIVGDAFGSLYVRTEDLR